MNRSWHLLRRGLVPAALVGALGFGVTQALAAPAAERSSTCPPRPGGTFEHECHVSCVDQGFDYGYCEDGTCVCVRIN